MRGSDLIKDMVAIDRLSEAKQVGTLYHFTSFANAASIIKSDTLKAFLSNYVSLTRNKRLPSWSFNGRDVMFVVDGDKLSNRYKLEPFQDAGFERESEERVKGHIKGFKKYVKEVRLYADNWDNDDFYSIDKVQNVLGLNYEPTFSTLVGWIKKKGFKVVID